MIEKGLVTREEFKAHLETHPLVAHNIWPRMKEYVPGWGYSQAEIDAFFEGETGGGKKQVHWDSLTGKPATFTPSVHAVEHDADGGDPLSNPLLLGASPVINWQSGNLLLQTAVTDGNTYVEIKGQGTGYGGLRIFDNGGAEYLELLAYGNNVRISAYGTSPGQLFFQYSTPQDIKFWPYIASGNPYLYIYGYETGVGVKYGRIRVDTSGFLEIDAEVKMEFSVGNAIKLHVQSDRVRIPDDVPYCWGGSSDFAQGYYASGSEFQIVEGAVLNTNVRAKLNKSNQWFFSGSAYYIDSTWLVANNQIYDSKRWDTHLLPTLSAEKVLYNVGGALSWWTANIDWLSDVNIDAFITPYEACLLAYDQNSGDWVAAVPEYDIQFKSYQIMWEFWDWDPPSPWARGPLNAGTPITGSTDNHPGYYTVRTRAAEDATGSGYYWIAANNEISVGGLEQMDFVFRTHTPLTGVRFRLGFQDSITTAVPVDGIYFDVSADATLRGICRSNNDQEVTGTTYTIVVNTWYRGRISINSATEVGFKLYNEAGALLWSQQILTQAKIPTGIARAVGFGVIAWLNFDDNLQSVLSIDLADLICARGLTR